MPKISRPILYSVLAGIIGYAGVVLTEPDAPTKKAKKPTKLTAARLDDGITEADLTAHFDRYRGKNRNAFLPKIVPAHTGTADAPAPAGKQQVGSLDHWSLTGINSVNGVRSAVLENTATQQVEFVRAGDRWNNMRVIAVELEAIIVVNALHQQTRLTFEEPKTEEKQAPSAPAAPRGTSLIETASNLPSTRAAGVITLPGMAPRNGNTQ